MSRRLDREGRDRRALRSMLGGAMDGYVEFAAPVQLPGKQDGVGLIGPRRGYVPRPARWADYVALDNGDVADGAEVPLLITRYPWSNYAAAKGLTGQWDRNLPPGGEGGLRYLTAPAPSWRVKAGEGHRRTLATEPYGPVTAYCAVRSTPGLDKLFTSAFSGQWWFWIGTDGSDRLRMIWGGLTSTKQAFSAVGLGTGDLRLVMTRTGVPGGAVRLYRNGVEVITAVDDGIDPTASLVLTVGQGTSGVVTPEADRGRVYQAGAFDRVLDADGRAALDAELASRLP